LGLMAAKLDARPLDRGDRTRALRNARGKPPAPCRSDQRAVGSATMTVVLDGVGAPTEGGETHPNATIVDQPRQEARDLVPGGQPERDRASCTRPRGAGDPRRAEAQWLS